MKIITKDDFNLVKEELSEKIKNGEIFIYPTDTIYGLGCNATNETSVLRLRNIKNQHDRPLSVIVPSVEWVRQNCIVTSEIEEWLKKLPGPYTIILKLKNDKAIAKAVNDSGSIGIRIPKHHISKFVNFLGFPIISTSANVAGNMFMTSLEDLDIYIRNKVDFFIDDGEIRGRPSTIVFLDKEQIEIRKR